MLPINPLASPNGCFLSHWLSFLSFWRVGRKIAGLQLLIIFIFSVSVRSRGIMGLCVCVYIYTRMDICTKVEVLTFRDTSFQFCKFRETIIISKRDKKCD